MEQFTICTKDLMEIHGLKKTAAVNLAAKIKDTLGRDRKRALTVFDLCEYYQIPIKSYTQWLEGMKGGRH